MDTQNANSADADATREVVDAQQDTQSTADDVRTLDNRPAAGDNSAADTSDADKADTSDADKAAAADADKDSDKDSDDADAADADKDSDDADKDSDDADADDLTDDDMAALDAKARRRVNKYKNESVNLRSRLKDTTATLEKQQHDNMRLRVALNSGLTGDDLKFLTGDTEQELEENAADLVARLNYGRPTPSRGPVERNPRRGAVDPSAVAASETDLNAIGNRIYAN